MEFLRHRAVDKKGNPIEGYVGFAVDRSDPEVHSDVFPVSAGPYYGFGISDRLMQFLREHDVTNFDMTPLEPTPVDPSKP